MKTSFKVMAAIFALGFVLLAALHVFLQYGLTKAMRDVVLPHVRHETGIDVQVGRLSLNVAAGRLFLKNVSIQNPEGFALENLASIDRIEVVVGIASLFRQKPLLIKKAELQNAVVNVVRNPEGELNINKLQKRIPAASGHPPPDGKSASEPGPGPSDADQSPPVPEEAKPLPELLVETLKCSAKMRYKDMKHDAVDLVLALNADGHGLSTQRDPATPWGHVALTGSLGDDRASFVTDLAIELAPVTDPREPSFNLTGKIMEIDPCIMEEACNRLGIRSAPFGVDSQLHCRAGWFENSRVALNLSDIQLEDKLARRLGGMGSIDSLRFVVPVEGSLQSPEVDVQAALVSAIGGSTQSLLNSFIKSAAEDAEMEEAADAVESGLKSLGRKLFGK